MQSLSAARNVEAAVSVCLHIRRSWHLYREAGHPNCMKWSRNTRKIAVAQEYNWRCMECKTCEDCCEKGDDVSLDGSQAPFAMILLTDERDIQSQIMFCDRCDRGWHLYCLDPPLQKPPKGKCSHSLPLYQLLISQSHR